MSILKRVGPMWLVGLLNETSQPEVSAQTTISSITLSFYEFFPRVTMPLSALGYSKMLTYTTGGPCDPYLHVFPVKISISILIKGPLREVV